ncbi:MAG: hypothetical protein JOZ18_16995 [Chloroflexi bacterium]|nr:hypothetical protein [Chloroflexota bacterium]
MDKKTADKDTMWVLTGGSMITRGSGAKPLKVEELSVNVNLFIEQMGSILEKTPEKLGKFHFDEFEVHADITAQGTIVVLGTGVQAGATGGLKFVFRRSVASSGGE